MRRQTAVLTALMSMTFMMSMAAMAHAPASATTFAELRGRLVIGKTVFVIIREGSS